MANIARAGGRSTNFQNRAAFLGNGTAITSPKAASRQEDE